VIDDSLPDLSSLRTFARIADEGSLAAAGRSVGLSASAIGKTLTRLEARLGVRLFHRSTRSLTLTEEGTAVLARARRIAAELEGLQGELSGRASLPSGRLRLSLPLVGEPFLGMLASFSMAYPAIDLDIDFSDRQVDLIGEGFDAAIRSGTVRDARLMATALGSFRMELAASPAYLDAWGTPEHVTALAGHRCIGFRFAHDGRLGSWPLDGETKLELRYVIVSNDLEARVAFAVAGAGVALLPSFALVEPLQTGRLVRILPNVGTTVPLTLIWPSSHHLTPKMQAFSNFIAERARRLLA
jgi:DNA-binding transcriptional LysR family regulator